VGGDIHAFVISVAIRDPSGFGIDDNKEEVRTVHAFVLSVAIRDPSDFGIDDNKEEVRTVL
jgi:hypothetical protein